MKDYLMNLNYILGSFIRDYDAYGDGHLDVIIRFSFMKDYLIQFMNLKYSL